MARGKRWTRDELIIAMNLYCKLPFGQLDRHTPIIIEVAQKLERTPSSLSMKLCNLASLDPVLQARGIQGLRGVSNADRSIWQEFYTNWEELGVKSEELFQELFDNAIHEEYQLPRQRKSQNARVIKIPKIQPTGDTESEASVKVRVGQSFFRQTIMGNYHSRCCITGNPIPQLLIASHILPWGDYPEHRLDPHNGLCLARTQDAAFDGGMITFDEDYRLVLSSYLKSFLPQNILEHNFVAYQGEQMRRPEKFQPNPEFLRLHREEIFLGN